MKKNTLFALWGGLFILCAGMSFIPEAAGVVRNIQILLSFLFFIPPAMLLYQAARFHRRPVAALIRNLSILSLAMTSALLLICILTAMGPTVLGNILNSVLTIVSSPMLCSPSWALSMFLWACLLMVSISVLRKNKENRG